jgi:hypothetical protein
MKQPTHYVGAVHSFLNAASFQGKCSNFQLSQLLIQEKFKGCDTSSKAEYFVGFYCHLNKLTRKPNSLNYLLKKLNPI